MFIHGIIMGMEPGEKQDILGYSYLETPGNPTDGKDNDDDGITDERRDSGPGQEITGQDNIKSYVQSHYDMTKFETYFGKLEDRLAYKEGSGGQVMRIWIGLQDFMIQELMVFLEHMILGENDGKPTEGEPNFDKTDVDESDQIGLTGFKMNRIKAGNGIGPVDNVVFL